MTVIILRPDNFLDPTGQFSRIVKASTGPELLEAAKETYGFQQHPRSIEIHLYSSPPGCTGRRRIDTFTGTFDERYPLTVWVFIRRGPTPPAKDRDA